MRILLINDFYELGGAEIQTKREAELFRTKGHEVFVLAFDPKVPYKLEGYEYNYPCDFGLIERTWNRLVISKRHYMNINKIIKMINPDIIHVNNLFRLANCVMHSIKDYKVLQTIRDYGAVCPKGTCIHKDGKVCRGYTKEKCFWCSGISVKHWLAIYTQRKMNNNRMRCIDRFVSPSLALAECCNDNGLSVDSISNPFDFSILKNSIKDFGMKKVYLYYGEIAKHKGVDAFLDVLESISKEYQDEYSKIEVWFIGNINKKYEKEFRKRLVRQSQAKYYGKKTNSEIMDLYAKVFCVVVPSVCVENYPNTVLEAIANKTLVIGSNRGGIPELINDKAFLFDVTDKQEFKKCILQTAKIKDEEYKRIVENNYDGLYANNNTQKYYDCLMNEYAKLMV